MLFSEPKIPQCSANTCASSSGNLSVLFSEPKIPQSVLRCAVSFGGMTFSALQRAENSSMNAERDVLVIVDEAFSALQRAENSSMITSLEYRRSTLAFQCSSASRKFLNRRRCSRTENLDEKTFSALQRAENSSILNPMQRSARGSTFSALQRAENSSISSLYRNVSVISIFQCSSASRKFLNSAASVVCWCC